MRQRLYVGVIVAVEKTDNGPLVAAASFVALAKSQKDAERQADKAARSQYGRGYTIHTEAKRLRDSIETVMREEGYDVGTELGAFL